MDQTFYAGVGGGYARVFRDCPDGASCDDNGSAISGFVGVELNPNIGLEAGVGYLSGYGHEIVGGAFVGGDFKDDNEVLTFYLSAVPRIPLNDKVELFGKVGFHYWDLETNTESSIDVPVDDGEGLDFMGGAGVEYHFNDWFSARAEYTRFAGLPQPPHYFGASLLAYF